jgi:hypothetical protein
MAQHNLRRSLAAFAFVTFATLSLSSDLSAAPGRQVRSETGSVARVEDGGFSIWDSIVRFLAKHGVRIDGNGQKHGVQIDGNREKTGVRIDGNGHRLQDESEALEREKVGVRIDGNG